MSEQSGKRRAQTIVEYALILSLLAVIVISVLIILGAKTASTVGSAANSFEAESTPAVYVSSISLSASGRSPRIRVRGYVYLSTEDGGSASGATVGVTFSASGAQVDSQTTRANRSGRAQFSYRSRDLARGDVVRLGVTNVTLSDYEYNPGRNVETSKQTVIP
jgi:Flp pilus assembly pilin Flp